METKDDLFPEDYFPEDYLEKLKGKKITVRLYPPIVKVFHFIKQAPIVPCPICNTKGSGA